MRGWWLLLWAAASLPGATFYVSTAGQLGWSGRLPAPNAERTDGPLPSLSAARDAIRALRAARPGEACVVQVRGGTYSLSEPFVLEPQDSDVTYMAFPGERPVISGGRKIEGWRPAERSIWSAPANGEFRQLFVNGRRAQRARTPNYGFYRIDGPSSQDKPFRLRFRGNDIRPEWAGKGVEAIVLLAWAELRMPVVAVDEEARVATLAGDPRPSNRETDARYWIENAPGSLDQPGEWYLDREAGRVFYWPLATESMPGAEIIAPALNQLVRLEGVPEQGRFVRRVVFRGLDFRHTDWSMGPRGFADPQAAIAAASAFEAVGAEECAVERCAFSQHGGYALWFGRGCKRNRIEGNEIFDMGGGGIKIGETVQRQSEAERNFENSVTDNHIHELGEVYPSAVGIWVGQSARNYIAHNHIHDLYYTAISVGWSWGYGPNQSQGNVIEYNHLHHIGKQMLSDMGGIYTLGVGTASSIRNNLIHDVESFTYGGWGIYPDEGSSEMLIENNVVYRCRSAGFHQHYGRDNIVRNNIFAFNRDSQLMRTRAEPHVSFVLERNLILFDSGVLLGGNWTGGGFRMNRNLYWDLRGEPRFAGKTFQEWREQGQDRDSIVADPGFVNAGSFDFALRPDSPARKLGFQPIDVSHVGPRFGPEWEAEPVSLVPGGSSIGTSGR